MKEKKKSEAFILRDITFPVTVLAMIQRIAWFEGSSDKEIITRAVMEYCGKYSMEIDEYEWIRKQLDTAEKRKKRPRKKTAEKQDS